MKFFKNLIIIKKTFYNFFLKDFSLKFQINYNDRMIYLTLFDRFTSRKEYFLLKNKYFEMIISIIQIDNIYQKNKMLISALQKMQ